MEHAKEGWGAVLRGESTDLEDWRHVLSNCFDPWTEVHGEATVLRSKALDMLDSAIDVRARSLDMIDYLNGALAISKDARPVAFGGALRIEADGKTHSTTFGESTVEIRAKVSATGSVINSDGSLPPTPPPQPSDVQLWAKIVEEDDTLHEALIYFGKEQTWFNIYKTLECLESRFGGGEAGFAKLKWADAADIKLMKRTANTMRHAKGKFEALEKPMSLRDARLLLGQLLHRGLTEAQSQVVIAK